jgi:glycosyltransferase involved in cell wall biosynthesis
MPTVPLFSVIMLHYNQEEFAYQAIDSVLDQTYPNIEFIFADDCSPSLDLAKLASYVKTHKRENIANFVLQVNKENVGTVKNVNGALRRSKGEYLLFFAADDRLYDAHTIQNFADAFRDLPEDRLVATGQCLMFDEKLEKFLHNYVDATLAHRLNKGTAHEQFLKMAHSCIYAMGATAVKRELFKNLGYMDERYTIIEDWSLFLRITREGVNIEFCDFDALRHRDGGVSHHKRAHLPPHVLAYRNDIILIQEHEILPYLARFPVQDQRGLLTNHKRAKINYAKLLAPDTRRSRAVQALSLYLQIFLSYLIKYVQGGLKQSLTFLPASLVSWGSFELLNIFVSRFHGGLFEALVGSLPYRFLASFWPIVVIAHVGAIAFFAILTFLNFCRRSAKVYRTDRSLKKYLANSQ